MMMYDCVLEPLFQDGGSAPHDLPSAPPPSRSSRPNNSNHNYNSNYNNHNHNDNYNNNNNNIVLKAPSPDIPGYAWRSLTPLILGRNATTRISLVHVSRQVCQLQWRPPPVTRRCRSNHHNNNNNNNNSNNNDNDNNNPTQWVVRAMGCQEHSEFFVNGRCLQGTASVELQENDVLSLYRSPATGQLECQYKVRFLHNHPSPTATAAIVHADAGNQSLSPLSRKRRARIMDTSSLSDQVAIPEFSQTTKADDDDEEDYDDNNDDDDDDDNKNNNEEDELKYLEEQQVDEGNNNNNNNNNKPSGHTTLVGAVHDELSCAICLDILVQSTLCVPCGHSFCQTCLAHQPPSTAATTAAATTKACPTCRTNSTGTVPNRQLDNVIGLLMPSLSADDQEHYRNRLTALHLPVPAILAPPSQKSPPQPAVPVPVPVPPPRQEREAPRKRQRHHRRRPPPPPPHSTMANTTGSLSLTSDAPLPSGTSAKEAILID